MGGLKGEKTIATANFSSTQIQTEHLNVANVKLTGELTVGELKLVAEFTKLLKEHKDLQTKVKELEDKVNSFETE